MKVLHLSDIHYRKNYTNKNKYESMLLSMDSTLERLQKFMKTIDKVDCIVITGDLCDDGTCDDYTELKTYLDSLSIPYVLCLGNHDKKQTFYKGWFNKVDDKPYLGISVIQDIPFIYFDNSKYGYPNGYVDDDRLNWLKEALLKYPKSVVLMHHQFEDLPGIPGLEKGDMLKELLIKESPLAILTGHTHWFKQGNIGNVSYYTAPSFSFRGLNVEDGSVIFTQAQGYNLYEISKESCELLKESAIEGKHLATWKD